MPVKNSEGVSTFIFLLIFKKKRRQGECRTFASSGRPCPSYTFIISGEVDQCKLKWTVYELAHYPVFLYENMQ